MSKVKRALVCIANVDKRNAFVNALRDCAAFAEILSTPNLERAHQALISSSLVSHVFLSGDYELESIANFIDRARMTRAGDRAAYILLLKPYDQLSQSVSNHMMIGIHGFLCEPFTVECILEVLNIAHKVSLQNSLVRLKAAVGLMLTDISAIDRAEKTSLWKEVEKTFGRYRRLTGQSLSVPVVRMLREAPQTKRFKRYTGVSKRVRSLIEKIIRKNLFLEEDVPSDQATIT